jgi:lipopolysaccharide/colanic/teichoic acid biosynthesis glycosyltransferase
MRRSGDVLIACVLLAITLPLLIITAAAIGLESSGPILKGAPVSAPADDSFRC